MNRIPSLAAAVCLAGLVPACADQAPESANQQNVAEGNMSQSTPSDPFAQAEMQMKQQMAAAVRATPSQTWVAKMIEHHRGAVQMSEALMAMGGDPTALELARATAEKQRKEIADLEKLLEPGDASSPAQAENPFSEAVAHMEQQMMAASGATPSETWMRKMLAHHRGGVDMSNVLLRLGGDPDVIAKARMTAREQAKDAAELEKLLGEPAATASVEPARAATKPAAASSPREKGATKTAPGPAEAEPDPHAGHDMGNMSH